ncbi:unnamed protein product [Lota lota]
MGLGYIVIIQKKSWYFNVDPSILLVSGYCGTNAVTLSLTLPNNSASLQLTYALPKGRVVTMLHYVTNVLEVMRQGDFYVLKCKTYPGELTNKRLFEAPYGQSYQCKSQSVFVMTEELQVKLVPLQIQAFKVPDGGYGQEVMCPADLNRVIVPTILWATAIGLLLIAVLTYLIVKDRRANGYERL